MDGKARLGKWVLLSIIVVLALSELALAGLSIATGQFKGSQVGRVLLTGWLLWQVWDGVGWARWLLSGLFLAAAVLAGVLGVASPAVVGRPELVGLLVGMGAVCVAFGVGLASPWVGAYQAARRGSPDAEPGDAAGRGGV
jgi:hypothetical protein